MGGYRTTITFLTDEPVTPGHLTRRLLEAAGEYGALRPGEGAILEDGTHMLIQKMTAAERQSIRDLLGGSR